MNNGLSENIINKLKNIFNTESDIEKAILFGSRANGHYSEGSDIDIALIGSISFKLMLKIRQKIEELNIPYNIDLLNYSNIKNEELKKEILNGINLLV